MNGDNIAKVKDGPFLDKKDLKEALPKMKGDEPAKP